MKFIVIGLFFAVSASVFAQFEIPSSQASERSAEVSNPPSDFRRTIETLIDAAANEFRNLRGEEIKSYSRPSSRSFRSRLSINGAKDIPTITVGEENGEAYWNVFYFAGDDSVEDAEIEKTRDAIRAQLKRFLGEQYVFSEREKGFSFESNDVSINVVFNLGEDKSLNLMIEKNRYPSKKKAKRGG